MSTFGRDSKKNKACGTSDSITFEKDKPSEPPTALLSKKTSLRNFRQHYFRKRQAFGTSDSVTFEKDKLSELPTVINI